MLGKTDVKVSRPRDGRHCDLCGCSFPAVRCDKCGSQIFCLSCDDMYHRHPKRRFHLRKAVDPTPTPQARPVLPMKVSQLASTPGDPSKMPLPPPRKKKPGKSFFDSFRRGSPSSDNSPPLPKKEYSWSDRLGSIKKFMSNRPLPPLPKEEDNEEPKSSPPVPRKNDLSFIHKRVDDKPPQLPHRMQAKSPPPRKHSEGDILPRNQESHVPDKQAEWESGFGAPTNNFHQAPFVPPIPQVNGQANRDSSEREFSAGRFRSKSLQDDTSPTATGFPNFPEQPNLSPTMPPDFRGYSTLKRAPTHGQDLHNQSFMSMPGEPFPGIHTSSSVTELHALDSPSPREPQQFPNFPMSPHYPHPYPMYPHYPNYPQYFGTSFANLSTVLPNADRDFSDHSDASSFSAKKHKHSSAFGMKAKRSQSVMYDRMAYPPQYYPFGGFPPHPPLPGYGTAAWGQSDHPVEAPPSPATSARSFGRSHRSRHRKKKMLASDNNDEDDERLSVRSSPRSRTTSSSDRLRRRKTPKKFERSASPSSLTSSEDEEEEEENQAKEDRLSPQAHTEFSQGDGYQTKQDKKKEGRQTKDAGKSEHKTKQHGSKTKAISHQKLKTDDKNFSPKVKKKEREAFSSSESMDVNEEPPQKIDDHEQDHEDAEIRGESDYHSEEDDKKETAVEEPRIETTLSENQWQCEHCTFINNKEHRICQVCCKTKPGSVPQSDPASLLVQEMQGSSSAAASPILNTTSESLTSDTAKEYLTPPVPAGDDSHSGHSENEGQNFAKLNSDLEQAEKELSRGLMELMKLKEESDMASNAAQAANRRSPENIALIDKQVITTHDAQTESNLPVPQTETLFPQVDKIQTSNEQLNEKPNDPTIENVVSKSIGTDAMDIMPPAPKTLNFGLFTQDQISPANSFTEITASAPSQKEIGGKPALRRDSSCQTYQNESATQIDGHIPTLHHEDNIDFQYPYNRADAMLSPQLPPTGPSGYRGFAGRGQGLMHRSHSRSSLFGDRYGDARNIPPEFDNLGFGYGPSPMYRSLSRSSLTGDYTDPWMSEVRSLRRPDFYLSMEELVERRRLETKRAQGLELVKMIREAEQQGFTADDIHVALNNCGKQNPVNWLQTNWKGMVDTVVTLATNYGKDKHENDIGILSDNEARDALRMHKGNIWAAVTECVEGRQRKFLELSARGNFSTKEIVDALTQSEGNVELAYTRLSNTTFKPFLMRIWGTGEGVENQDGAVCDPAEFLDSESSGWPKSSTLRARNVPYGDTDRCSDQEDWDDDDEVEEEVSWNDEEDDEMENPENFDIQPQIMRREKRNFASNNIATPESDSEYCDAFDPVGDARSATSSSPVDEIFFVSPDTDMELQKDKKKGTSFLSRLAALRKNKKPQMEDSTGKDTGCIERNLEADSGDSWEASDKNEFSDPKTRDSASSSSETNKTYGPLNILKQTFSAIKDSVIGSSNKNEAKHPRSITEARTIIVHDKSSAQESVSPEENEQKGSNHEPSRQSSLHTEHKEKDIGKSTSKPYNKGKKHVREHSSETSKCDSENKALSTTSAIKADDQMPSVSKSAVEVPLGKQQSNKNSVSEVATSTNAASTLNNSKTNLEPVSLEHKPKEDSLPVLTKSLGLKSVADDTMKEEKTSTPELSKQPQNISITKQEVSEKSEESRFKIQENSGVVPEKATDSSLNSKEESRPQVPSPKPAIKSLSNETDAERRVKHDSEIDNSLAQETGDNIGVANDVSEVTAKSPDVTVIKNSDEKQKTKRNREGLHLKLPDLGKTSNSEMQKDLPQPDKENEIFVTIPKTNIHLKETEPLKEESDRVAQQGRMSQNSQRDDGPHSDDVSQEGNSSSTIKSKEGEEKNVTDEKPITNLSENEFRDMASKITEKLENCLEVLKSSEAAFTESEETTPSHSENKEESASGKVVQSETDSSYSESEISKENTDSIVTDVAKTPAGEENKYLAVTAKSPSPVIKRNEVPQTDDVKETSDTIPEVKGISAGAVDHGIQDIKVSIDDKTVTNSSSHEIAQTAASTTNAESSAPEMAPSSPATNNLDEAPAEFAGVKAKTFTGFHKKAKNQLYGNDKKQSSVRSPTPNTTHDVKISGKTSADKKDSADIKQAPVMNTDINEGENVTQLHTGEIEEPSLTTKEENVSYSHEQLSLTTPEGYKKESSLPFESELQEASGEIATTEQNTPAINTTEPRKEKLQLENSESQAKTKEKRSAFATTKGEPSAFSTSKFPATKFEDQDMKSSMPATGKESPVSISANTAASVYPSTEGLPDEKNIASGASSEVPASPPSGSEAKGQEGKSAKATDSAEASAYTVSKEKEQDGQNAMVTSTSETTVPATSKGSDIKTKIVQNAVATTSTETTVPTTSKGSDIKTKEVQNAVATTGAETTVPTTSKGSDIKTKEVQNVVATTGAETIVPTTSKGSDTKTKEVQNAVATTSTETTVPTTSKGWDIKTKELQNAVATTSTETADPATSKDSDTKTKEVQNAVATTSTETTVPTTSKGSDIKTKEVQNVVATTSTKRSFSITGKSLGIKAQEQDTTTTAKTEASVTPRKTWGFKAKEKVVKTTAAAVIAEASASTPSKDSAIKAEELDSKRDVSTTVSEELASAAIKDTGTKAKERDAESLTSAATNEAPVSTPRRRDKLKVEIQGETENSNSKDDSVPSSPVVFGDKRPTSRVDALKNSLNEEREGRSQSPIRPQSPFGRMTSLTARKEAIAHERNKEVRNTPTIEKKPWFIEKAQPPKPSLPKRSIKQQLEFERKIRNLVSERKCRTYRKAEIVVQLLELNFSEEAALQAAHECSNLEQAISYLQQECLLCTGMYPVGQIVSMIHCPHKACRECIKAYFTIQIRDRTIMELLCPFCNEPDICDEDVAQDYFNHLDMLLKKLVEPEIHELFQRKLRDRVLMKDPNFRWCSQCSSGFIAMPNLKRLICPDCNAITCAKCRRSWEREHEGISCEAFAAWKDANDPEAQTAGLAKLLQEDGIDCPNCHFRYTLAKGGCMHFRCIQCQHDFCSGCSKPFKMGQKCGVSDFCGKLGLHAHHPRNCLFYLRDKDPEDLQRLLELNDIDYNKDPPDGMELKSVCQVMEQKETPDGLVDDICGKEVQEKQAGLCRVHYVEYLGQLVNKNKIDPIQIFCNDDLELVLRRASKRLPAKSYRDTEIQYREKLVQLIHEELPLEQTEGS